MIEIQPASLQKDLYKELNKERINIIRADKIREKLTSLEGKE